jgi:hypothetical protein
MKFNLILNVLIILVSLFTAYNVYYIYNKKNVEKTFTGLDPTVRDRILNDLDIIKDMNDDLDIIKAMNKSSSTAAVTQRNAIMKYIVKNFDDLHKDCTNKEKIDPVVQYKCGLGTKLINNTCEINWGPETVSVVSKQWDNSRIEKKIYVDLQRHIKYHNEVPRGFKANFDIFPNPNARRC